MFGWFHSGTVHWLFRLSMFLTMFKQNNMKIILRQSEEFIKCNVAFLKKKKPIRCNRLYYLVLLSGRSSNSSLINQLWLFCIRLMKLVPNVSLFFSIKPMALYVTCLMRYYLHVKLQRSQNVMLKQSEFQILNMMSRLIDS